jgi:hypothetical protein
MRSNEHWRLCRSRTTAQSPADSASAEPLRLTKRRARAVVTALSADLYLDQPHLPEAVFHQDIPRKEDDRHAHGQLDKSTSAE